MHVLLGARAMIPTSYKDRLPKDLSWPVNAQVLSEALEGVPQYDMLTVSFSMWSTFRKSEFVKQIEDKSVILVLGVYYCNKREDRWTARYLGEKGFCGESWQITVYPVPRNQKAIVRQAILSSGLADVRKWLGSHKPPSWYDGRKSLSLGFDLAKEAVVAEVSED
jgi:hypothetical protein